jgi:hypothetical protein
MEMRTAYDVSPLRRSTIGVDPTIDVTDGSMRFEGARGYPPHDVEAWRRSAASLQHVRKGELS